MSDIDIDSPSLGEGARKELRTSNAGKMEMTLSWGMSVFRAISGEIKRFIFPFPFAAWFAGGSKTIKRFLAPFPFGAWFVAANNDLESSPESILFTSRPPANNNLATTPLPFRVEGPTTIATFSVRPQFPAHPAQVRSTRAKSSPPAPIDIDRATYGLDLLRYWSSIESGSSGADFPSPAQGSSGPPSPYRGYTGEKEEYGAEGNNWDESTNKFIFGPITSLAPRSGEQYPKPE
ncbi:hypothetical protein MMC07_003740 [Pseudocyphellaria aurata]|nr:hypothetical protein [Pseudocyphellaria aurata]